MLPQDTTELYIDSLSILQISSGPPALNHGLSNRNRHFCIENGMLTKLTAVGPDPMKLLKKKTKHVGTHLNVWE